MVTRSALRALPLVLLAGCALMTQRKAWPDYEAPHQVKGPTRDITVTRDELGVPHIRAESKTDALFALGFVHGQDRLFQADLSRRLMYGQASTLFGERSVKLDGFTAGLQIRKRAEKLVSEAPFEVQAVLEAYSAGINAGRDSLDKLPVEYGLLGVEEVPDWTPADCIATVFLQSWNLSENPDMEMAALALRDLDAEELDALLRFEAETPALDGYWKELRLKEVGKLTPGWRAWTSVMGGGVDDTSQASNNWIVGPSRSRSRMPIVANDPHLAQRVPSIWYAADMQADGLHAAGVTFPGTPAVVIGHNDHVAWGLTNVMADYIDFAILETADDGKSVVLAGEKVPLEEVTVEIQVKKSDPVSATTWWTPVGPVISEVGSANVVVMRWHALELEDESTMAWWKLNQATSVQEAIDAMDRPLMVAQNMVVADVTGDWAWQSFGSVPVRKNHTGRVPYPGSDAEHGWDGWYAALPGERQPERGWVATANWRPQVDHPAGPPVMLDEETAEGEEPASEPAAEDGEESEAPEPIDVHGISTGWAQRWRHTRIAELLDQKDDWSPSMVAKMQTDVKDQSAAELLPGLLEGVKPSTSRARTCHKILSDWDHQADPDAAGPLVWLHFQRELLREALLDDIGERALDIYLQANSPGRNLVGVGLDDWVEDRPKAVDHALTATCSRLEANFGEDPSNWRWGDGHVLALKHPFGDSSFLLKGWNAPERAFPGSSNTVAAASVGWGEGEQHIGGMASMRIVMPLDDLSKSTLVYPGGQSGFPKHPLAFTHFEAFVSGETLPLYFSDEDVAAHAVSTQVLSPPGGSKPTQEAPAKAKAKEPAEEAGPAEEAEEPAEEAQPTAEGATEATEDGEAAATEEASEESEGAEAEEKSEAPEAERSASDPR